jgi:hypothetical protein
VTYFNYSYKISKGVRGQDRGCYSGKIKWNTDIPSLEIQISESIEKDDVIIHAGWETLLRRPYSGDGCFDRK